MFSVITHVRRALFSGLLVVTPLGVTLFILIKLLQFTDGIIALVPPQFRPEAIFGTAIPGLGTLLAVLLVYLCGVGTRLF